MANHRKPSQFHQSSNPSSQNKVPCRPSPRQRNRANAFSGGVGRRRFLQASAAAVSGIALSNCRQNLATNSDSSTESAAASGDANTLHIYTWADYTTEELISQFTEKTGIDVVVDIYGDNETMLARLQAGGGDAYSIIYPSDYMVQEMVDLGMLMELDASRLQGMDNLNEKWQSPVYDPNNAHSVPFSWGTTGLIHNKEILETEPQDWDYLWENSDQLSNRLTLLDDMRETIGAALKSLGYSYNSTDPSEIEAAYERLVDLKPYLSNFMSYGFEDQILGGDLIVVMGYSSDGIEVMVEDENLDYVVPKSGSSLWTDTLAIPKSAPNVDAAYEWINFMLEPEVTRAGVQDLYFSTPNKAAYELLPDELKNNTRLYPPEEVLANCEGIAPVGDATELYEQYWTELTSA